MAHLHVHLQVLSKIWALFVACSWHPSRFRRKRIVWTRGPYSGLQVLQDLASITHLLRPKVVKAAWYLQGPSVPRVLWLAVLKWHVQKKNPPANQSRFCLLLVFFSLIRASQFLEKKVCAKINRLTWFQRISTASSMLMVCMPVTQVKVQRIFKTGLRWHAMHGVHIRKVEGLFLVLTCGFFFINFATYHNICYQSSLQRPAVLDLDNHAWSPYGQAPARGNSSLFNRNVYHQMSPFHVTV